MKISQEFPSKYVAAADLENREVRVTMGHVEREALGEETKPVLYFQGKEKGLVLNKTNAKTIADHYGDDTEDWHGQSIILFAVMVSYQGKTAPAVRCRIPTARDNKPAQRKPDPISSGPMESDDISDIADTF